MKFKEEKDLLVAYFITGSPSLQYVLTVGCVNTLYVNSWIGWFVRLCMGTHWISQKYMIDIVRNDEIKLTYLLFSVYLSVLCSLWHNNIREVLVFHFNDGFNSTRTGSDLKVSALAFLWAVHFGRDRGVGGGGGRSGGEHVLPPNIFKIIKK